MTNEPIHQPDREERLDQILAEYYQETEAGQTPEKQEFLARHPDLATELEEFFADKQQAAGGGTSSSQ